MTDYISREAAKRAITSQRWEELDAVPAADVRPVVHGKWEPIYISEDGGRSTYFLHRQCGCEVEEESNYCPNCGAQMDGR